MQLSTVKRERLIPPAYLLSIALLLTVAFLVLLPSRDIFTFAPENKQTQLVKIDDLDLAYIRASEAAGTLSADDISNVISALIRGERWQDARELMADRPDAIVSANDQFILDLETARVGYLNAGNEARNTSYSAELITLLTDFLDSESLHDVSTLTRAATVSAELKQPELSASYSMVLANADQPNAAKHLKACAQTLVTARLFSQAESCYRTAIARATDPAQRFDLNITLVELLAHTGERFAADKELEHLVQNTPLEADSYSRLARLALASERPDLAYPLYAQLSTIDEKRAVYWLEKAATWSQASNLPGLSAEYLASIIELSDEQYHAGLNKRRQVLLVAAGRNEEALQTIHSRLISQPRDGELLLEGIKLASAMGLSAQAMEWNEQLLEVRPFDEDSIQRQIDLALATRQLSTALHWSVKFVELDPDNRAARTRLAQLEEWNGNIINAQQQRVWLAERYPSQENDRELLRLSELNWDSATAAKTLERIAGRETLSHENIIKLVALYEADGRPDLAIKALTNLQTGGAIDSMLIREHGTVAKRHKMWEESLSAWETYAARFGRSNEESLNRMELHWRLRKPLVAFEMAEDVSLNGLANATPYQLNLLANLGWKYRNPNMVIAAAPHLERINTDESKMETLGQRVVQSHLDNGHTSKAISLAERLWRKTENKEFLLSALRISLHQDIYPHTERYLDASGELLALREIPGYWVTVAEYHNKRSDTRAALETFEHTLMIQPDNKNAMAGIIWTLLGDKQFDADRLADTLDKYETVAVEEPQLWSPFAIAKLKLEDPQESLRWFSKIMLLNNHDYNILLTFADALEQTGNVTHAARVRQHTLKKLRPVVLAQSDGEINAISRDYISLLQSYGSVSENEAWAERLLAEAADTNGNESAWRQELAASWYLNTQRNDFARLILTNMHEKRLQSPAWQQLAVALADDDINSIEEILASGAPLTSSDQIMALRKTGNETQAYALALQTMRNSENAMEVKNATEHVIALRPYRPEYYSGTVKHRSIGKLNITESGLSLRHTLAESDIGFSMAYNRRQLDVEDSLLEDDVEADLALTAHFGNSKRGGSITTGLNSRDDSELNYSGGEMYISDQSGRRQLNTEVYINEIASSDKSVRMAGKQDRAAVSYSHSLGKSEYLTLSGRVNEVKSRATDETISRGFGASIELGTNGNIGSNSWSMGVIASQNRKSDKGILSTASNGNTQFVAYGGTLENQSRELALNAALFRGGIASEYPQAASPRYHLNAKVGHNIDAESTAFNVSAGAGFRILGNDELSFSVEHDRSLDDFSDNAGSSVVGVQYRNHF